MTPELDPPIEVLEPMAAAAPLVVSSPHSGSIYPPSLLTRVALGLDQLRRLEDGCVDALFECALEVGAPLLRARFARAYVDPNREAFELDPDLFAETLPGHVNVTSSKARAGLGTIPSRIGGRPIYRSRLSLVEAQRRIDLAYWPYHQSLRQLLAEARARFGTVLLLDCHSMPTLSANGSNGGVVDVALGDRYGRSCAPVIIERVEQSLRRHGLRVARNQPYAGGFITTRYGAPETGVHALQIEIRRDLYMDERSFRPRPGLARVRLIMLEVLLDLAELMADEPGERAPDQRVLQLGAGGL